MVTLYYDDTTRQDVANSLPTSGEGRRVMQMYMFVTIHSVRDRDRVLARIAATIT